MSGEASIVLPRLFHKYFDTGSELLMLDIMLFCGGIGVIILFFAFIARLVKLINPKDIPTKEEPAPKAADTTGDKKAKKIGDLGEDIIYEILENRIYSRYKILRNVYITKKDGKTAEIDALIISGRGIYVIESKNRSGIIYGKGTDARWTQFFNQKKKYPFYNPAMQNEKHIEALKFCLKDYPDIKYFNIVVFNKDCTLKVTDVTNAYIIKSDSLDNIISEIVKNSKDTIPEKQKEEIIQALTPLSQPNDEIKKRHTEQVKETSK